MKLKYKCLLCGKELGDFKVFITIKKRTLENKPYEVTEVSGYICKECYKKIFSLQ